MARRLGYEAVPLLLFGLGFHLVVVAQDDWLFLPVRVSEGVPDSGNSPGRNGHRVSEVCRGGEWGGLGWVFWPWGPHICRETWGRGLRGCNG